MTESSFSKNTAAAKKLFGAAAELVKKRAALAQLTNINLPKIFYAIGKQLAGQEGLPPDLSPCAERIRSLESQIVRPAEAAVQPTGEGFAAKAKQLAQTAAREASIASAKTQLQAAYFSLGKAATEGHGETLVPQDLLPGLRTARDRISTLTAEVAALNAANSSSGITPRRIIIAGGIAAVGVCAVVYSVGFRPSSRQRLDTEGIGATATAGAASGSVPTQARPTHTPDTPATGGSGTADSSGQALQPKPEQEGHARVEEQVAQVIRDNDVGNAIQVLQRLWHTDPKFRAPNNGVAMLLDAYNLGANTWMEPDGRRRSMRELGLADRDWRREDAMPVYDRPFQNSHPMIDTSKDSKGTNVTLLPVDIQPNCVLAVTFVVIPPTQEHKRAQRWDHLVAVVELFGGNENSLTTSTIKKDTPIDLWSPANAKRITLSNWRRIEPEGHMCDAIYAPLLFEVLASQPEYILIEGRKRTLSPVFRQGCQELCETVLQIRAKNGQANPPKCLPAK